MITSFYGATLYWRTWRWRKSGNGLLEVVVLTHLTKENRFQYKFPGGGGEPVDRDALDVAQREGYEETGILYHRSKATHLITVSKPDEAVPGGIHEQSFFAVPYEECEIQDFRVGLLVENDSIIDEPRWVNAQLFLGDVFHSHRAALEELLIRHKLHPRFRPGF